MKHIPHPYDAVPHAGSQKKHQGQESRLQQCQTNVKTIAGNDSSGIAR